MKRLAGLLSFSSRLGMAQISIMVLMSLAGLVGAHSTCHASGLAGCRPSCPHGKHDFRDEGTGQLWISQRSSLTWHTVEKDRFLGITVSSEENAGAVQISRRFLVTSTVTVCSKCRRATGMVFMTLNQLQQLALKHPEELAPR